MPQRSGGVDSADTVRACSEPSVTRTGQPCPCPGGPAAWRIGPDRPGQL